MSQKMATETLKIKNMVCNCCIRILKMEFEKHGIKVENIKLGEAEVSFSPDKITESQIENLLNENGFELITDREKVIVENIKLAVIELIHQMNNIDSIARKSDYIVEKLSMSYQHLSKIFSKHESLTLEKFIILHKIEKIKEVIDSDEYTLSEIAFMMDYSSVAHLSAQFKRETGMTVSDFKKAEDKGRVAIDQVGLI
jgi:AraC family transcriptional regulator